MMTKRSTKNALLSSVLALFLCFTMLIGTTFAWFTDSVTSANNIITAGNLDIELEYAHINGNQFTDWSKVQGSDKVFDPNALWEPGRVEVAYLKVSNLGSLALKYDLSVNVASETIGENVNGEELKLSDHLVFKVVELDAMPDTPYTRDEAIAAAGNVQGLSDYNGATTELKVGAVDYVALIVYMPATVGNEANYRGNAIPTIELGINLFATQASVEEDSFGKDYDESAPALTFTPSNVEELYDAFEAANDGDIVVMPQENNSDAPLTETIVVDKDITIDPNGMYLVSNAAATFTVVEGGKLTITDGSYTVKNTSSNGAAVLVDGGEFEMAGGSFDAHTAVRTTAGKSSTVTLSAGWSNRVTVGFELNGNDTLNVTGGSLYTRKEAIKTADGTHVTVNMTGGTLSGNTDQYSAVVNIKGTTDFNMTGGSIASTYQSGYNGSPAIMVDAVPSVINISGSANVTSKGNAVVLGDNRRTPEDLGDRFTLKVSGDASISATSDMGFGIRVAHDCCDVIISGNATVNATYQAIQMNMNAYVFANSTLTIAENAKITSTAGRIGGGYAIAANGNVTITGGTITGTTAGLAVTQVGSVIVVDNSTSGTPITINKVDIAAGVDYTVAGNPSIAQ